MKSSSSFYLCASGEVRKRADAHRAAHLKLSNALFDVVHGLGAKEASVNNQLMKLRGIKFPKDAPAGWTKPDKHGLSRPQKTAANAELLRHFTPGGSYTVEWHSDLAEFFTWLKCPAGYSYKSSTGEGWTRIGDLWLPVGLFWYSASGPILLQTPDLAAARCEAREDNRRVTDNVLNWKPPKGCKPIMIEEWELMRAKYKRRTAPQAKEPT